MPWQPRASIRANSDPGQIPSLARPPLANLTRLTYPLTSVEQCNDLGQHYGGPVVVVVNANTYSSGDLFTAGIVDNHIAPVVCIGQATGAGGANVWTSDDLSAAMKAAGFPMPALADGANLPWPCVERSAAVTRKVC